MIIKCMNDGEIYDENLFESFNFKINKEKDVKNIYAYDEITGETTGTKNTVLNFVGFITNTNNDMLAVFPKNFKVANKKEDSQTMFNCISYYKQKTRDIYIGEKDDNDYISNFPFSSFFKIYEYFKRYGIYLESDSFVKPNSVGKISWKDTINKSNKYFMNGNIIMFPLYFKKNYCFSNFLSECMIFAIDYTVLKFGDLLGIEGTEQEFPAFDFLNEKEYVISILQQIKQNNFKDIVQALIDNLIDFFSSLKIGGDYYLKHYSFSSIWEDMVNDYLCKHFREIDTKHSIVFDESNINKIRFKKQSFHVNGANQAQFISPDHYYGNDSDSIQMIFDAKYYTKISGLNYKQVAYTYMLRNAKNSQGEKKYKSTYSALILPSSKRKTRIHFRISKEYGADDDIIITEEYIDIRDVMIKYLI